MTTVHWFVSLCSDWIPAVVVVDVVVDDKWGVAPLQYSFLVKDILKFHQIQALQHQERKGHVTKRAKSGQYSGCLIKMKT